MARRKRKSGTKFDFARVLRLAVGIALISAAAWYSYTHWSRAWLNAELGKQIAKPPRAEVANQPAPQRIEGMLAASGPARDGQLGVSANAAVLFRRVEMYQWQEHCDGDACRYDKAWSAPVNSRRFREPKGHENPPAPFNDSIFFAPGLKIGEYALDPDMLVAQLQSVDYAVHGASLPPNLAATFSERDGVLYAGGDPAHPAIGEVRVSYRVVPSGTASLNGVVRGGKLNSH